MEFDSNIARYYAKGNEPPRLGEGLEKTRTQAIITPYLPAIPCTIADIDFTSTPGAIQPVHLYAHATTNEDQT